MVLPYTVLHLFPCFTKILAQVYISVLIRKSIYFSKHGSHRDILGDNINTTSLMQREKNIRQALKSSNLKRLLPHQVNL